MTGLAPDGAVDSASGPYRVLIADDEPLARDRLRRLLASRARYTVVAECEDGRNAAAAIAASRPDILLLDVRMPDLDGLAVAATVGSVDPDTPLIIFVTAFEEYALEAIDAGAIDYLRKPVTAAALDRALDRAECRLRERAFQPYALALLERLTRARSLDVRFAVHDATGAFFVAADTVDWIEADGNYVRLHVGREAHLMRGTIGRTAMRLDPDRFTRVHRSAIVNVERIARLQAHAHGEYTITLRDGTRLVSGRAYNGSVRRLLRRS